MVDLPQSMLPRIQAGDLVPLAITSAARIKALPNVATWIEQGVMDNELTAWYVYLAPKGTPAPIVARMSGDVGALMRTDGMRERLSSLGAEPIGSTAAEFAQLLKAEVAKWAAAVRASGAKVE
jgi:tripartite-type tricarboxylate transporter receptor subunit TctC